MKHASKVDRRFKYRPAIATNVAATFARVKRNLIAQEKKRKREERRALAAG